MGTAIVGGSKLLSFILKILVSQLGVVNFSDYYLATSTFIGLTTVAALGVPMSATRFISFLKGRGHPKAIQDIIISAATIVVITSVLVGASLYGYAEIIAILLGIPHTAIYLRILSFGLIGSTMTLLTRAVFLGLIRIRLAYIAEAIEVSLKFVLTIAGILVLRWGVVGALIGYIAGTLLAACINTLALTKISGIQRFIPRLSPAFLHFAWPVSASEILTASANIMLLYIVRIRGGAETMGFYAAAVSIASLIHIVPQMILSIFLPIASNVFAQKKSVLPIYKTLLLWLGVIVLIPSIFISIISPHIISFIFGPSYTPAAAILSISAIAYGVYAMIAWPNRQLLDMAGYTRDNLMLTGIRIVISVGTLLFMHDGIDGAGLARAVLYGWIGEAVGSLILVKHKRLI